MSLLEYTCEDARMGMQKLAPAIERYANLVVRKGVNVKPGQEVVVQSPVECAEFARLLVKRAYAAGAGHVTVIWGDDEVSRLTYENVETAWFENVPEWQKLQLNSLAEGGACFIFVEGADPEALKGIDPAKPAAGRCEEGAQHPVQLFPPRLGLQYQSLVHRRSPGGGVGPYRVSRCCGRGGDLSLVVRDSLCRPC